MSATSWKFVAVAATAALIAACQQQPGSTAGTFARALVKGPEAAVPVSYMSPDNFDKVDSFGRTRRERMINWVEELVETTRLHK